jgi:hypothetical protein
MATTMADAITNLGHLQRSLLDAKHSAELAARQAERVRQATITIMGGESVISNHLEIVVDNIDALKIGCANLISAANDVMIEAAAVIKPTP